MRIEPGSVEGMAEALTALRDVAPRQVMFGMAIAMNRTMEDWLAAARKQIAERMTVRVATFTLPPRELPRIAQATRQKLQAQAAFGYSDVMRDTIGERREKILRKFETGGTKEARDPFKPIAIPTSALRRSFGDLVPRQMFPENLRLQPKKVGSGETLVARRGGKVVTLDGKKLGKRARIAAGLEGIGGTFTINDPDGKPIGVYQRIGRGRTRADVRRLWTYKSKIRIPDRLDVFDLADVIVRERLLINFQGAIELALRTAK